MVIWIKVTGISITSFMLFSCAINIQILSYWLLWNQLLSAILNTMWEHRKLFHLSNCILYLFSIASPSLFSYIVSRLWKQPFYSLLILTLGFSFQIHLCISSTDVLNIMSYCSILVVANDRNSSFAAGKHFILHLLHPFSPYRLIPYLE